MLTGHLLTDTADSSVRLIAVDSGDKVNAIPSHAKAVLCVQDAPAFVQTAAVYLEAVKAALAVTEPQFDYDIVIGDEGDFTPMLASDAVRVLSLLTATPDGVIAMSRDIDGLVETSLNLGILQTDGDTVRYGFALRSNKQAGLTLLEQTLCNAMKDTADTITSGGHYPPWEYREQSLLRDRFVACYTAQNGHPPKVEAIHAGLECAVFASRLEGLDCISCGPSLADVHTPKERLSISSAAKTYRLLSALLKSLTE